MSISTTRIRKGHYETTIKGRTWTIKKNNFGWWRVTVDDSEFLKYRASRKRDCVEYIAKVNDLEHKRNTTFSKRISNCHVLRSTGWGGNHCAAIAVARALADDPSDVAEVVMWAEEVKEEMMSDRYLGHFDDSGSHWGGLERIAPHFFPNEKVQNVMCENGDSYGRRRFPTVAQWLRANSDVTEAIVRTTGHVAYYKDGVAFALRPKMRVDSVIVLEKRG